VLEIWVEIIARLASQPSAETKPPASPRRLNGEIELFSHHGGDRMPDYQITIDGETVHGLFQGDAGLAKLLEQVLNQVLEAQVSEQLGAGRYERTEERQGYRNGVRPRQLTTRVGRLRLRVPQVRDGQFSPELFARYQRSEQALVLALMEMVVNGVSTRKVTAITEELGGTSFSKSTVSALCARLDPVVAAWNERPLGDQAFPFVLADALVIKVREQERVRALAALIAIGINAAGYREILGIQLGDSESEGSWSSFFGWLKRRGLAGGSRPGGLGRAYRARRRRAAPLPGLHLAALPNASGRGCARSDAQGSTSGAA
jgi:putative transposase